MAFPIAAAVALAPSLIKLFSGSSQKSDAAALRPVNPGYQQNQGILDNARMLRDRYSNYTLPGAGLLQNQINNNFQNAAYTGIQGATSGGDVADLAARLAYGKNVADNNLAIQTAQGKDAALGQYLSANALSGAEAQAANAYDREQYERMLNQKAALTQAGNQNMYDAIDTGASVLSGFLNPKSLVNTGVNNTGAKVAKSIFDTSVTAPTSAPASTFYGVPSATNPLISTDGTINQGTLLQLQKALRSSRY